MADSKTTFPQQHYELLINSIDDFVLIMLDTQGHVISWNPGAEKIKGYMAEEVIGKHFSHFFTPEALDEGQPERILRSALLHGRAEVEGWRVRKDGSPIWVKVTVTPLYDDKREHIGFSKVTRDVSRRKNSEDELQQTLKELADIKFALDESAIVAVTDKHGVITYVNDTFCRISGYSREEVLGKTHRIINSHYHPGEFFRDMWGTISQGQIWRGEVKNKAKDGSYYWVDTTIVPFLDDNGNPYQYIAIRHEITARKRVEAEIRQLNEEMEQRILLRTAELQETNERLKETLDKLQESERLRSTFISALTHDLRTPLVAQERALELFGIYRDKLPPKLGTLADRLLKSNEGLLDMVNLLLETYQYESGKINLLWETVDMGAMVNQCFEELLPLADSKQISLSNAISEDVQPILGDSHQIKRVLMNLIGNALQNIPAGCEISIRQVSRAPDAVTFSVKDNGQGIPPDALPHLFERYYIGDHTRKKIGTGLGLYICRMIMEQHQGSIRVESESGNGTEFFLTFNTHHEETTHG